MSLQSSPQAAKESLLWCLEHLLSLFLRPHWCLQSFFFLHTLIPSFCLLLSSSFFLFLNILSQRHYHLALMDSALASDGSVLQLADVGSVKHERNIQQLLTKVTTVASTATKTLPYKSNTIYKILVRSFINRAEYSLELNFTCTRPYISLFCKACHYLCQSHLSN